MRKSIIYYLMTALMLLMFTACEEDMDSSHTTYTLTYTANANGTITGITPQTVNKGSSGTAVTAVANSGYHFSAWSDGSSVNPRTDTDVQADLNVSANFEADPTPLKRIFILGSSTVHAGDYISGNFNDPYGSNRKLEGWGEQLKYYMKDPSKVYNRARSGADSVTYRDPDPIRGDQAGYKDRYWGYTETLINATNDNNGGFLLIQFGANDAHHHVGEDVFKGQLEAYIADARRLGLIPVLLSPPNNRNHYNSRPYAKYVEPVAVDKNVLFLDLHQKSMDVWANYDINEDYDGDGVEDNSFFQTLPEADILYGYLEYHRGINNTHFSPVGANIVAGWVKELACQSDRDDAKLLCSQFLENRNTPNEVPPVIAVKGTATIDVDINTSYIEKGATASDDIDGDISANVVTAGSVDIHTLGTYTITYSVRDSSGNEVNTTRTVNVVDISADIVTVHEDAEDGDTSGWNTYGTTAGSTIANVEDNGSRVIELSGADGTDNGFSFSGLNITSGFVASWRLKYTEDFRFFVQVRSTNSPDSNIYMEYTPDDISTGLNGSYIHNGLGADANDGTWHTFTRDVEADFHVIYPDENITRIVGFAIRGSGRIDDISTSTRAPRETFVYNGHTYKIVKSALSWQDASSAAHVDDGYLANIGSIAENHEIYSRLYRYIADAEYAGTVASNGGNASYVWIGANDIESEGTWIWEDNDANFWSGGVDGASAGGLYNNWGRNTNEEQREPDNADNQDAAAMAITEWQLGSGNLGQSSQWNDLKASDALYYVVEYEAKRYPATTTLSARETDDSVAKPTVDGPTIDPVYHTRIKMVDKPDQRTSAYPKVQNWSADMRLLRVGNRIYNAKTLSETDITKGKTQSEAYHTLCSRNSDYFRWSNKVANKFYVLDSSNRFVEGRIRGNDVDCSTVLDTFSDYEVVHMGPHEGNIDYDDRYVVFEAKKPDDTTFYVILYDIQAKHRVWTKTMPSQVWEQASANGRSYWKPKTLDWLSVSPSGKYIVFNNDNAAESNYTDGMYRYDINLTDKVKLQYSWHGNLYSEGGHGDIGFDTDGHEVFVQFLSGLGVYSFDLDNPTELGKELLGSPYGGGHISCRNSRRPGWCYVTANTDSNGNGLKRVFALKLDGTGDENIQNFSQTHIDTGFHDTYGGPSPDGTQVIFNSHWGTDSVGTFIAEAE